MKNEYMITKRMMKSWINGWWFNSTANTALLLFACFFGVVFFIFPSLFVHYFGYYATLKPLYIALFAICYTGALFMLSFIPHTPRLAYANPYSPNHQHNYYKTCSKNYCAKRWQRVIKLTENEIIVDDKYAVLKFEYSTIKRVKEKRNMVIIFLKSGFEIRLYKNAFVNGSWEACKKIISRKSSVKIR